MQCATHKVSYYFDGDCLQTSQQGWVPRVGDHVELSGDLYLVDSVCWSLDYGSVQVGLEDGS